MFRIGQGNEWLYTVQYSQLDKKMILNGKITLAN